MTERERNALSTRVADCILGSKESWIRRMFELGRQMRADGGGPVWDLSLGNPSLEPPELWREAVIEALRDEPPGMHRYMTNAGFPEVRAFIAAREAARFDLPGLEGDDVTMTVGAAGAVNVMLRCVADRGDRVIVPAPYFAEYDHYADNHGATLVPVPTGREFSLDLDAMDAALRADPERARVLILNSPNNPTGAIYSAAELDGLTKLLEAHRERSGRILWVVEDSPYRDVLHDPEADPRVEVPSMMGRWPNTVLLTSHSKDLGLAGERIGYMVISPEAEGRALLRRAASFANRTLGFVNAPALMQRVLPKVLGAPGGRVDVQVYAQNSRKMADGLRGLGFELPEPRAGFFLFPALPEPLRRPADASADTPTGDITLTERLREQRTVVVPGTAFGVPEFLRLSMCVDPEAVDGALSAFRAVCA
ncbi:aspartate aminotransferase [Plesiocystis pacifica SIR-1]|uniref:Aspartate aminotransferase n=1 Tax=Plesiocystis pacifica SIR-1 TaxID=391625 RepID=A6GF70_9BACT|nr:pyridoxal phosphate-dependent aminotransferase [Plesiocystis pacifica]EDM75467.1 aspartate aminotransferase [Plesiocystis pacifica SIR-1]